MLTITTDVGVHERIFLDLEASASEPYTRFVYESREQADRVRRLLLESGAAEFTAPHARLLLDEGQPAGMMACLRGRELQERRLRAAWILKQRAVFERDPATERALRLASQTLLKPRADDYYLSRIAVAPAVRGRGLARFLLQRFEEEGRERGCARLLLEVDPANAAARNLYLGLGYAEVHRVRVEDAERGRVLEYAHLLKPVGPEVREA